MCATMRPLFSWRELDSLLGVSKYQEEPQAQLFNHNNTYHQPNGEDLENEEEVCKPLMSVDKR